MTAFHHPEIVSKLILSSSAALGREVAPFLRIASLPFLGELMTSGVRDPVRTWLRKSFYDKSLASGDMLDELRRTNSLTGPERPAKDRKGLHRIMGSSPPVCTNAQTETARRSHADLLGSR